MSDKIQGKKGNEKEDREWKCLECSKSYLSYPAFYTHTISNCQKLYNTLRSLDDTKRDKTNPRVIKYLINQGRTWMSRNNMKEKTKYLNFQASLDQIIGKEIQATIAQDTIQNSQSTIQNQTTKIFFNEVSTQLQSLNAKVLEQEQIQDFIDPLQLSNELEEFP
ncbi:hypothetical protein pb186bvf_008813 [Paramecium bursaria]